VLTSAGHGASVFNSSTITNSTASGLRRPETVLSPLWRELAKAKADPNEARPGGLRKADLVGVGVGTGVGVGGSTTRKITVTVC
jgi:hypothetical protein